MKEHRVVITGLGIISPIGNDVPTFWNNLKNGVCGIDKITEFDTELLPVHIAGKIKDFDPLQFGMDKPFARKQGMFTQYGVAAAYQAMNDSGLRSSGDDANIDPFRLGVYVGSGIGGFEIQFRETQKMIEDPSGQWISPLFIPSMISNIAAGHIAIQNNARGACINVVTACATSSHNLGEAYRAVKYGYADAILSGGCEYSTIPLGIAGFANAKALSRAEDPKYASLPFNLNRGGFVMGDGGAILELHTYIMEKSGSDDCRVGVHLDWDGVIHKESGIDLLNEVDVLTLSGNTLTFISCKSGKMNYTQTLHALYELDTVANRFGGRYCKRVLVTAQPFSGVYMERAREMNIEVRVAAKE